MIAIAFRFLAGRYHATPWNRHVNEADVEWPPSPWRILRGLVATWHRKLDHSRFPESELTELVEILSAQLPIYHLPDAIRSHTRHYMPVRQGKRDKPVLVFDAFVRLQADQPLVTIWPDTELNPTHRELLRELLERIGFLGRAESWVEAELLEQWTGKTNCQPSELSLDTTTGESLEPIRLIAPVVPDEYIAWRAETIKTHGLDAKKPNKRKLLILKTLPEHPIDALRLETDDIQKAGWSRPPAARFVTYQRPYRCFMPQPRQRKQPSGSTAQITTVRLALAGKPLPRIEDAVRIGELIRRAAISQAIELLDEGNVPPALSGHALPPNNRHAHAFYLPEDADDDGHIDHIIIHADIGLAGTALRALHGINRLWDRKGRDWQVMLEQHGHRQTISGSLYTGDSHIWKSSTPYLHPWHTKKNFSIQDQIRKECQQRNLPEPRIKQLPDIRIKGRPRLPVHFHRFRDKRGLSQPDTRGSFWQLTFPTTISGPLALGFGCHYGLGLFEVPSPKNSIKSRTED